MTITYEHLLVSYSTSESNNTTTAAALNSYGTQGWSIVMSFLEATGTKVTYVMGRYLVAA